MQMGGTLLSRSALNIVPEAEPALLPICTFLRKDKRMQYIQRYDAEWVDVTDGDFERCCDCGLVHKKEFQIIKGEDGDMRILRRAFRDNRATSTRRRVLKTRKRGLWKKKKT